MNKRKRDSRFKKAKILKTTSQPNIGKTIFATTKLRRDAMVVPMKRSEWTFDPSLKI
jgi:hypothetical protein